MSGEAEAQARALKATLLVDAFRSVGATADQVAAADDLAWDLARQIAGTRPASDTTRALVVGIMRRAENRPDPFEGMGPGL